MLPIVDKPVVQYVVEELARAGIDRVLMVTGRRKRAIEDHFDADPELAGSAPPAPGVQLFYTRQPSPAGLGDAVRVGTGSRTSRARASSSRSATRSSSPAATAAPRSWGD